MSDEKALLAAIWEHPHEDTPRLMYADWLQETEEPANVARAEFIRLECERARLDEWDDAARVEELKRREEKLWKTNAKAWKADLPKSLKNAAFRRGFVYPRQLGFGGVKFLKLPADAFDAAPQWAVTVRSFTRQFDKLFTSPLLLRVDELGIEPGNYSHDVLEKLADKDRLRNVSDLFVSSWNKSPASVAAFYGGPATQSVVRLFAGNLEPATFAALAASRTAGRLRHLSFWLDSANDLAGWAGCNFGAERFPRLRSLKLHYSTPGSEGASLVSLLTAAPTAPLRRIEMNWCRVTDDGMERLAAWPGLAEVRHLELDCNMFREAGYRALARSPFAGNLTYLKLDGWNLRDLPKLKAELEARFGAALHYRQYK